MIPKIIHYCWFGGKPLPHSAKKCIASWRKFFPDYEIKEWNESNFDVNVIPYTAEAYATKKYAFVSDYARFYVLHEYGGLYFDTDVEVIRPMDDILERGGFMGMENSTSIAPGLGLGIAPKHSFYSRYLNYFSDKHFTQNQPSMVPIVTQRMRECGWIQECKIQTVEGITIYPPDYFCPQAMMGAPIQITNNTRSIHHFDGTWLPIHRRLIIKTKSFIRNLIGKGKS
jgi:hypothetical protein